MKSVYVTFRLRRVEVSANGGLVMQAYRYAIPCTDINDAREVASDVYSIDGITHIYINKIGRLKKGVILLPRENYTL